MIASLFRRSGLFALGASTMMSALLAGCGGGGTSGQNALEQGRSAISSLSSGHSAPSQTNFHSAFELFLQALQRNPNSSEAHFGAAISLVGFVGLEFDGVTTAPDTGNSIVPSPPPAPLGISKSASRGTSGSPTTISADVPPVPDGATGSAKALPFHSRLGLFWRLTDTFDNPYTLLRILSPITDIRAGMLAYYGYGADDVAYRQKMLADLDTAAEHLSKVEADPNFKITLPIIDGQAPVTIGLPEVYLFDAYVQSMRVELNLSLAYVCDPGTTWEPPVPPTAGGGGGVITPKDTPTSIAFWGFNYLDKNGDHKLTPDEYLPPSPYLTLRDAKYLAAAQQAMLNIVDRASKGIDGVMARSTTDTSFLVSNTPEVSTALTNVKNTTLVDIKQAATGPVTLVFPIYQPMPLDAGMLKSPGYGAATANKSVKQRGVFNSDHSPAGDVPGDNPLPVPPFPAPIMEKITINLAAWFTAPPADLKVFAPTIPLDESGFPRFDQAIYPDKTFGGLFPNGLPTNTPV
ncbi:MAG: hypothetical protein ABJA67_05390 [Chthonomonadales bacterium]